MNPRTNSNWTRPLALAAAVAFALSCTQKEPISAEPLPGTSGQTGGSGGETAAVDAADGVDGAGGKSCPAGRGPDMVRIETPDGSAYCIDRTEVTQAQYAAFLATKPAMADQKDAWCLKYNYQFDPVYVGGVLPGNCSEGAFTPESTPDRPMPCVDWCDAHLFCAWAGKRLCGSRKGGRVPIDEAPTSLDGEWYYACTNGGLTKYPYGDSYVEGRCGGPKIGVDSRSDCHGVVSPFDQILGLNGGLYEWEDACDDEPIGRHCFERHGSTLASCEQYGLGAPNQGNDATGFRCCAD
jgi:formylglycine-generating enzyme